MIHKNGQKIPQNTLPVQGACKGSEKIFNYFQEIMEHTDKTNKRQTICLTSSTEVENTMKMKVNYPKTGDITKL